MIPILLTMIPTMVGTAMLVGLDGSSQKGALLFGSFDSRTDMKRIAQRSFQLRG